MHEVEPLENHQEKISIWGKRSSNIKEKRKYPNEAKQQLRFIRSSFVKKLGKIGARSLFMKACEFSAAGLGYLLSNSRWRVRR